MLRGHLSHCVTGDFVSTLYESDHTTLTTKFGGFYGFNILLKSVQFFTSEDVIRVRSHFAYFFFSSFIFYIVLGELVFGHQLPMDRNQHNALRVSSVLCSWRTDFKEEQVEKQGNFKCWKRHGCLLLQKDCLSGI